MEWSRVLRAPVDASFRFVAPLVLTGLAYDSQRYWGPWLRGRIRVSEPYEFDRRFFGISTNEGILIPSEWWQRHTHALLDLVTGFYYLSFIGIFILVAAYFRFWLARKGTRKHSGEYIRRRALRVVWAFFWVNLIGYSTYYWYAAAPPWYVTLYGLGPADPSAQPYAAGALRFDQLLGVSVFESMYSKSANVFGAIPSLHVSYPLIATYFAFRFGALRVFCLVFYLMMCFSAVYLNHHYILDLIWGSSYALVVALIVDRIGEWRCQRSVEADLVCATMGESSAGR